MRMGRAKVLTTTELNEPVRRHQINYAFLPPDAHIHRQIMQEHRHQIHNEWIIAKKHTLQLSRCLTSLHKKKKEENT